MRRVIPMVLAVLVLAVPVLGKDAPATRPASGPSTRRAIDAAQDRLAAAQAAADAARTDAIARLEGLPQYKAAAAEVEGRRKALEAARASGTSQEKLDASAAFNRARLALDKLRSSELSRDEGLAAATTVLDVARDELARLRAIQAAADEHERHLAAQLRQEAEARDPVLSAMKAHEVVLGMSEDQLRQSLGESTIVTWLPRDTDQLNSGGKPVKIRYIDVGSNRWGNFRVWLRDGIVVRVEH